MKKEKNIKKIVKFLGFGVITAILYAILFINEEQILSLTSQGRWSFVIPIAIAFAISFAHGSFTSEFWDVLGIKAKK